MSLFKLRIDELNVDSNFLKEQSSYLRLKWFITALNLRDSAIQRQQRQSHLKWNVWKKDECELIFKKLPLSLFTKIKKKIIYAYIYKFLS